MLNKKEKTLLQSILEDRYELLDEYGDDERTLDKIWDKLIGKEVPKPLEPLDED